MKKILFVATVDRFFGFYKDHFKDLSDKGWIIEVASYGETIIDNVNMKYNLNLSRSPFKISNFRIIKELKKIINENNYDIIHCHTPIGGLIARLAAKKARKRGTKVIYTAHGFHFYKGAPMINWLLYYPVEKYLSKHTDLIITINKEDFGLASRKFKKTKIEYINGVGINPDKFYKPPRIDLFKEFPKIKNPFIMTFVGELNDNKNQQFLIKSMKKITIEMPEVVLALVGKGPNKEKYEKLINDLNLKDNIKLLGYRNDVPSIFNETNIVVSSSIREGLGLNVLEGMILSKIVLVTKNRGHKDLINDSINGFLYKINDKKEFIEKVNMIKENIINLDNINIAAYNNSTKYFTGIICEQLIKTYETLLLN